MSKRFITTLIIIMVIVMAGLILFQYATIRNAARIKDEQFSGNVRHVMTRVVNRLEELESSNIIVDYWMANIDNPNGALPTFNELDKEETAETPSEDTSSVNFSVNIQQNENGEFNTRMEFTVDSLHGMGKNWKHKQKLVRGHSINRAKQDRPGNSPSPFNDLYQQNSHSKEEFLNKLQSKTALLRVLSSKLLLPERPIEEKVDPASLQNLLRQELKNSGIDMEYKYAVYSHSLGKARFIMGDSDFDLKNKQIYSILLFPSDIKTKANYLYLYFPDHRNFILHSAGFLVIPSILLILMILAIFILTINIILRQKKLSAIKNDFINNMTHELKTPISTISLASQMLQDSNVANTPKTIEHVSGVIFQEAKRLSFQVEKVLQMAIFNEGRLKLKFKDFDVNDLARTVVQNFELRVKNNNGVLLTELNATNAVIKGDEVHLTNVLFNLLDNALKYSKNAPEIIVATENKKDYLVLSVKDNGIGIAKEYHKQIFERFYRVPTGNVHDVKGFGLGLSYVKKIIDAHSGIVKVESAVNKGTKFLIYFPLIQK
ncbi:MAG: HAMP domain-containing sensor histidine kinase [Bacteroidota bacterium]|nr:HAMP domain-containing sensor histidine kinase [Bacteroidota bacterium]MDP4205167.1 HAMP domain-containing sensor histidine kinase [Bacteroidota bacterium]